MVLTPRGSRAPPRHLPESRSQRPSSPTTRRSSAATVLQHALNATNPSLWGLRFQMRHGATGLGTLLSVQAATSPVASSAVNRRTTGSTCSVDALECGAGSQSSGPCKVAIVDSWKRFPANALPRRISRETVRSQLRRHELDQAPSHSFFPPRPANLDKAPRFQLEAFS
jgi:hypothetical protein